MPIINAVLAVFFSIFKAIWQAFSSIFRFFFGTIQYAPPAWLRYFAKPFSGLRAKINANPINTIGILGLLAALTYGGLHAYAWYEARPKPVTVKVTLVAPTRTIIEEKLPPNPLLINFDQSVAPIELFGKVL